MAKQKSTGRVLPDLPFDIGADEAKIEKEGAKPTITVEQLQAQIAAMQSTIDTATRTNMALMQQAPVVMPQMKPTDVDLKGLPDPVDDPAKYAQEIAARTRTAIQNEQYNQNVQAAQGQDQTAKFKGLWEDFASEHPEYAKYPKRVEVIAADLADKARARGRDVSKYIFGATETFFADAIKLYDKEFGKPVAEVKADDDDDEGSVLTAAESRTQGIPGGGPAGAGGAKKDEDDGGSTSMFQPIKNWQQKTGFSI